MFANSQFLIFESVRMRSRTSSSLETLDLEVGGESVHCSGFGLEGKRMTLLLERVDTRRSGLRRVHEIFTRLRT